MTRQVKPSTVLTIFYSAIVVMIVLGIIFAVAMAGRQQRFVARCHHLGGFVDGDHCLSRTIEISTK